MKISTASIVLKTNVKSQLEGVQTQPLVFAGAPGIGKTRSIEAISAELGVNFVHYSIPELTTELLSGLTTVQ